MHFMRLSLSSSWTAILPFLFALCFNSLTFVAAQATDDTTTDDTTTDDTTTDDTATDDTATDESKGIAYKHYCSINH